MDDTGAIPHDHVGTGFILDIAAEILVGCPEQFLTLVDQVFGYLQCNTRCHHPVRTCFDCRRGIRVHNHGPVGMFITECGKLIDRTAKIQGTGRLKGGHEHALFRAENLGGLTHKFDTRHHERAGILLTAKASHFERVRNTATGFFREVLNRIIGIVMCHQHRILLLKQGLDAILIAVDLRLT